MVHAALRSRTLRQNSQIQLERHEAPEAHIHLKPILTLHRQVSARLSFFWLAKSEPGYTNSNSRRDLERKAPHVLHLGKYIGNCASRDNVLTNDGNILAPHLECRLFSLCSSAPTAFNNTAVQFLSSDASSGIVAPLSL